MYHPGGLGLAPAIEVVQNEEARVVFPNLGVGSRYSSRVFYHLHLFMDLFLPRAGSNPFLLSPMSRTALTPDVLTAGCSWHLRGPMPTDIGLAPTETYVPNVPYGTFLRQLGQWCWCRAGATM